MTRIALALVWLLHWLPLPLLAAVGRGFGRLLFALGRERRRVTLTNLRLCFPQMTEAERLALTRRHFEAFGRSVLERGILWWSGKERIQRLVRIEGIEHWRAVADRPVIWLAPHFVGLDMGGVRLTTEFPLVSMYSRQKNPLVDALLLHSRTRFGNSPMASRQDGLKPVVREMRKGRPFYYLPDMDFGARDAVFVPFFGVPTATVTAMSRLANITGAAVVPCVTRQLPGGAGYVATFHPAWQDFPSGDVEADTRRMNAFIESEIVKMPEQYYWLHKRFKTRPPGEKGVY
ncbi:lysophospholipid acyltransferase family protein [Sulfurisoma sediminicola]|uniref:KDO2-lipid IV(A) lauroyltransferase n=1 Tax=Sulfurisoma sediminicola TaxID=1381557 RepID=A0A497XMG3_9PROT|nr:lipid A biosynthesis acyltransferase [Sulfurisoma sediminicola]RLJ68495.1 KDO2-lipid IV(A) lauroyltransferase [Sulfurisoma sediminicola]